MNEPQTEKLYHSEANNMVLLSNRAESATRSLSGHLQSQPEGLQQCIEAQRVPNPFTYVEKLHELLPDCEKIFGPSQHLQVTQWRASINGREIYSAFNRRMEAKQPSTTQESAKNSPRSQKQKLKCEIAATSSENGKGQGTS
ncbi:hypothetical protein O181_025890 [Austropuccinia psidii MF-1]|uniref:Uncharacterized protein n=1 Tax=Austropuccinia psidii MF-1 TaxID=1389203 RepID=A0A9Q3H1M9_9BASI|nr:hypothetical protein [Austropuccinia psidii MF-1]